MIKGKSIANALIILLLIFISNDQAFHSVPSAHTVYHSGTSAHNRHTTTGTWPLSVTVQTIKKDKIRVRYINGECSYEGISLSTPFLAAVYTDQEAKDGYASFIYSSHHFIFKLRGPPLS